MNDDRHPEDRLRALLSDAAASARPPRPSGEFLTGAHRSLTIHRAVTVGVAASVVLLAVLFGRELTGLGDVDTGLTGPANAPGFGIETTPVESPEPTATDPGACDYPDERPSYLPWLDEGEEVGDPQRHSAEPGDEGSDFASLVWPSDESDPHSDYVSLFTQSAEGNEAHGEVVDAEIDGEKGRFEIAPGEGDAAVTWLLGSGRCTATVLTLRTDGWNDERLKEEITRVAQSLSEQEE